MIPGSGRSTGEGIGYPLQYSWASLVVQLVKNPPAMREGDLGLIPGLERSPGERKGYPLQSFDLENSMDCIVHGVAELDTTVRLSLSLTDHCLNAVMFIYKMVMFKFHNFQLFAEIFL